jgi:hypothetical protein
MKMRKRCMAIALAVAAGLAACGGGGSGGDEPAAAASARAGAAEIGAGGGRVDAVLDGGATVEIVVPEGALKKTLAVRIEPKPAAAGQLGVFTITAPQVPLLRPATLVVTLPPGARVSDETTLALTLGGQTMPVGAPVQPPARRLVLTLGQLAVAGSAATGTSRALALTAGRARAQADPIGDAIDEPFPPGATELSVAERIARLERERAFANALIDLAAAAGLERAQAVQLVAETMFADARFTAGLGAEYWRRMLQRWGDAVCGEQRFAVSALERFEGVDAVSFRRLVVNALMWTRLAMQRNVLLAPHAAAADLRCADLPADARDPVRAKLPSFRERLARALALIDPRTEFDQLFDVRISELIQIEEVLQRFDFDVTILDLIGTQTQRLRGAAYTDCRELGSQAKQSRLLAREVGNAAWLALTPYDEAALHEDIRLCGVGLRWELLDALGQVRERGTLGGTAPGQSRPRAETVAGGASRLVLHGPVRTIDCAGNLREFERLNLSVGPEIGAVTQVRTLEPAADSRYLTGMSTEFDLAELRAAAATIATTGAIRLEVRRSVSALCSDRYPNLSHGVIATLVLDFVDLRITTSTLPRATLGAAYSAQVAAIGGEPPYTWSAERLPAGLQIDAASGIVSGTPSGAQEGLFFVTVRVASPGGGEARRTIELVVERPVLPYVEGSYLGTATFSDNWVISIRRGTFPARIRVVQSQARDRVRIEPAFDPAGMGDAFTDLQGYVFAMAADGTLSILGPWNRLSQFSHPPREEWDEEGRFEVRASIEAGRLLLVERYTESDTFLDRRWEAMLRP